MYHLVQLQAETYAFVFSNLDADLLIEVELAHYKAKVSMLESKTYFSDRGTLAFY